MKTIFRKWMVMGAVSLLFTAPLAMADDGIEFHGYIRSGVMLYSDATTATANTPSSNLVGRLGNETDSWVESELVKKVTGDGGSWAKMHLNLSVWSPNFEVEKGSSTSMNLTQAYVEMGGMSFDPAATFFVGERYNREDIHWLDMKWRCLDGAGVGAWGLLGGVLDVNLLTNNSENLVTTADGRKIIPVNLDFRYKLLKYLQVEFLGSFARNIKDYNGSYADRGVGGAVVYYWDQFLGLPNGYSNFALQAGYGMDGSGVDSSKFSTWGNLGQLGSVYCNDGSLAFRALAYGMVTVGDWDIAPSVWFEYDNPNAKNADGSSVDPVKKISAVVRPVWKMNKNVSLAFEGGVADQFGGAVKSAYQYDGSNDKAEGISYKVTVAPTLALDSGFWARPQLRTFVTYEGQNAKLGYSTYDKKDSGLKFGVQAEAWW